jgi:hypothetical protein
VGFAAELIDRLGVGGLRFGGTLRRSAGSRSGCAGRVRVRAEPELERRRPVGLDWRRRERGSRLPDQHLIERPQRWCRVIYGSR